MNSKPRATLLLSDIHLGSLTCQPELLVSTFEHLSAEYEIVCIIIVGDGADDYKLRHFLRRRTRRVQRSVVEWLIGFQERGGSVRYCLGNHDKYHREYYQGLKYSTEEEFVVEYGGTRCMVIHGDRFDSSVKFGFRYLLVEFISLVYVFLQLFSKHCNPGHGPAFLERRWNESALQVMLGVCRHAHNKECRIVFYGHTHQPGITKRFGVTAVNLGTWTLAPGHCAIVTDSQIRLYSAHPTDGIHVEHKIAIPSPTQ